MKYAKNRNSFYHNVLITSVILISIAACSSGGDSGPPPDTTPPSITVTSHTDAQEVIGNRTITLQGNVSDDTQSVSILQNGTGVTATLNGITFSADITLDDRDNTLEISATDAANNRASIVVSLYYPFLSLSNGQAASMVIGQPDFVSSGTNRGALLPSANSLNDSKGSVALSQNGVLYVPDCDNGRILGFNQVPEIFDQTADFLMGQVDFTSDAYGLSDRTFACPSGLRIKQEMMLIVDVYNNRLLIWNTLPVNADQSADMVLGQSAFDTNATGCDAKSMNSPFDAISVGNKFIVADRGNNRVLVWNNIDTLTSGQQADIVLGQSNFTSCQQNRGAAADADTLSLPSGVWSDGIHLVVTDWSNNRVLLWNSFPTQNGQAADVVLGQADMQSTGGDTCQSCLYNPEAVFSNGNQLFVGDSANSRLLVWDSIPTGNNAQADRVIGQPNFVDLLVGTVSETSLNDVRGIFAYRSKLFVTDGGNNRVMIFEAP